MFRLLVPPEAEAAVAADEYGEDDDDGGVDDVAASVGTSDVLPLLAISASTIWTIFSLLDGEYGSSGPGAELTVTVASVIVAAVVDDGGGLVVLVVNGGLGDASVGSV